VVAAASGVATVSRAAISCCWTYTREKIESWLR